MPKITCPKRRWPILCGLVLAAALFVSFSFLVLGACTEAPPPEPDTAVSDGEPAFVGSAECRNCHEAEFEDWLGSHHDLAMQVANESTVLGDFDDAEFEYFGTVSRFFRLDNDFVVRTQDESGQVWLTYNDPQFLAARHGIDGCQAVLKKVQNALKNFARAATQP